MKFRKNMKVGVSIIFLLLIFTSCFSLIDLTKKNNLLEENKLSLSAPNDDWLEDNDDYWNATMVMDSLNIFPNLTIVGSDEDWFRLYLNSGDLIDINIYFNNSEGDLELELYDPFDSITSRAGSHNITDYEFISFIADISGDWRIRVYHKFGNTNVTYDFDFWVTPGSAGNDWMEPNDDFWIAAGIGPGYYPDLKIVDFDNDWFQIYLNPGNIIDISIFFNHSEGDLQLEFYDPLYIPRIGSYSSDNDEFITFTADVPGDWRIRVFHMYGNSTVTYDLDIWLNTGTVSDDWAEENDDFWNARWVDPNYYPGLKIVGSDEDWFKFYLNPSDTIDVSIFFDITEGDLQLELYDPSYIQRIGSYSMDNDEFITYTADVSGDWRIRVYHMYGNTDVYYELDLWLNVVVDDAYEENDFESQAYDLTAYEGWWLTGNNGPGFQFDDDWYEIHAEPGFEQLIVNFYGDVQLEVYDANLNDIDGSNGIDGSNSIDGSTEPMRFNLPSSGTYYIKISGSNRGYFYDFQYLTVSLLEEQTWLSDLYGLGVQNNLDFYQIDITPGFKHLEVELLFNHTLGNIDMALYDVWGSKITNSSSLDDNEYIDTFLQDPGKYLLLIQGHNMGNEYNLWWDDVKSDLRSDDAYELPNNDLPSAYDLSNHERKTLWGISGLALQFDEDWYKIKVEETRLQLIVIVMYDSAEGLMGFDIYDSNHTKLTGNFTLDDNDYIDYDVPSKGTYYIKVYGDNSGNVYNLWWTTEEYEPIEMIPGFDTLILILSIVGVTAVVIKMKRSKFKHQ